MSLTKATLLVFTYSLLGGIARGVEPSDEWAKSHFLDPERCTLWIAWLGHQIYQGQGGRTVSNDGMEVWVAGRPTRKNRQLGYMIYYLPYGSRLKVFGQGICPDQRHEADAVQVAKTVGGDAVIPLGRTGNQLQYRVIKYLPDESGDTGPVTDEHVAVDFDNTTAEKEESLVAVVKAPLEFAYRPLLKDYLPKTLVTHSPAGSPVLRICPDKDGKLYRPVTVTESSGDAILDEAAVRWATDARYKPNRSSVDGSGHPICDQLRIKFSNP